MKKRHFTLKKLSIALAAAAILLSGGVAKAATPENTAQITSPWTTKTATNKHVVKPGDSLWKIAQQYHCSLNDIRLYNPGIVQRPNSTIYVNEQINVPVTETLTGYENQVLQLVNAERSKVGLQPLSGGYSELNKSARLKATDMAKTGQMSHQSPTLGSPFDLMRSVGVTYKSAGENIAMGQKTPAEVMKAWMNSPGHKANILNRSYTHLGVGIDTSRGTPYWAQHFVSK